MNPTPLTSLQGRCIGTMLQGQMVLAGWIEHPFPRYEGGVLPLDEAS